MAAIVPVLPPGFYFHPTDQELVDYYLRRKILRLLMEVVIPEIDLCRFDPWELPGMSFLARRGDHQEWYFYSRRCPRYGTLNGTRIWRTTPAGYWKSTGRDRTIHGQQGAALGYKKTLIYHLGHAPNGERPGWGMHEYRLDDTKDAYALYRLYMRNGTTPSPEVASVAAADEEGASRQVVSRVAVADQEGVQVVTHAAAADNEQYNSAVAGAGTTNPDEGNSSMQFYDNAWYSNVLTEENNSWMQFFDDVWC